MFCNIVIAKNQRLTFFVYIFESFLRRNSLLEGLYRLGVRTWLFHSQNTGSSPVGDMCKLFFGAEFSCRLSASKMDGLLLYVLRNGYLNGIKFNFSNFFQELSSLSTVYGFMFFFLFYYNFFTRERIFGPVFFNNLFRRYTNFISVCRYDARFKVEYF